MLFKRMMAFAMFSSLTVAAACGGDDEKDTGTDPEGDTPTATEVNNMVAALSAVASLAFSGGGPGGNAAAGQSGTFTYNETVQCPSGGSTSGNGNYTYSLSGTTYSFDYTLTQVYNNCAANGNGTVYTFNGQGLTFDLTYTYNTAAGTYNYSFSESGNINWSGGNKGGSCAVNITVSFGYNGSAVTNANYSGTFCGVSI